MLRKLIVFSIIVSILDIVLILYLRNALSDKLILYTYMCLLLLGSIFAFVLKKKFRSNYRRFSSSIENAKNIKNVDRRYEKVEAIGKDSHTNFVYVYILSIVLLVVPGLLTSSISILLLGSLMLKR